MRSAPRLHTYKTHRDHAHCIRHTYLAQGEEQVRKHYAKRTHVSHRATHGYAGVSLPLLTDVITSGRTLTMMRIGW